MKGISASLCSQSSFGKRAGPFTAPAIVGKTLKTWTSHKRTLDFFALHPAISLGGLKREFMPTDMVLALKKMIWTGRIISGIPAILVLFGTVMKLIKAPAIIEGMTQHGIPEYLVVLVGNHRTRMCAGVCNSTYRSARRNFDDGLTGRRDFYECACRRANLHSNHYPCGDGLGRTLLTG
jgi:hypothetical protein